MRSVLWKERLGLVYGWRSQSWQRRARWQSRQQVVTMRPLSGQSDTCSHLAHILLLIQSRASVIQRIVPPHLGELSQFTKPILETPSQTLLEAFPLYVHV